MEDVRDLRTNLVAICPPGAIAINRIMAGTLGVKIKEAFSFAGVALGDNGLRFNHGRLVVDDGEVIIVAATFDERRIVIIVDGDGAQADAVMARIGSVLADDFPPPIIVVYETSCNVVLDFEWADLLSDGFAGFLGGTLPSSAAIAGAEPRVANPQFTAELKYKTPDSLEEHAVSLSTKPFIVRPMPKVPAADRRYTTSSPTRSGDHFRLLEALESAVSQGGER